MERLSGVNVARSDSNDCSSSGNNGHCGNDYGGSGGGGGGDDDPLLSITTFNVLAPIFKRVGSGRESDFRGAYLQRNADILEHLKVYALALHRVDVLLAKRTWYSKMGHGISPYTGMIPFSQKCPY